MTQSDDIEDIEKCIETAPCVASYGKQVEKKLKFIRTSNFIAHDHNEVRKYSKTIIDLDADFSRCICKEDGVVGCIALCESNSNEKYTVGIDFTGESPKCNELKNKRIGCVSQKFVSNSRIIFIIIETKGVPFIEKHTEGCIINIYKKTIKKDNMYEEICKVPNLAILYLVAD